MHNNHIPHTIHNHTQITIKGPGPGTHGRGTLIHITRYEWGCESVMCVYSGSYVPDGVGMWVALSVLYIRSVRDTRRDPRLITTLR
ncbi:hypothetical protein DPMN_144960 [Dreissena polymorpha]|uniref:Uncharacterized protein n=1 Tax=Dreissena polymorpha TaxID=45954 RepID=A0A9D4F531_DREPO|nr:hypothetical protein DPMN_144960 [Dreissena polymorpha]